MSDQILLHRDVLDSIGAGVVIVDPATRVIEWVNGTASALFGAPADQIIGRRCHRFLCPAEEGNCPMLDQGKGVENADRLLIRHDGRQLPVMKSVKRVRIDGVEKLLETFLDIGERKRAEEVLRESEQRYRALFEHSREAMMVLAPPAWTFVSANAATLELFGVENDATLRSLGPSDVSPSQQPDGRPSAEKAREMIAIAMRDGSHGFEWRFRSLAGREIPASVLLTRLEFAGQSVVQATVRDLSPMEGVLSALRASEARLRLAVDATGMGTYRWDHATGTPDYSPEFLALYGLPPGATPALGPDQVPLAILAEDRPLFRAAMGAGNDPRGDGVLRAEFRVRRPDGSIRWLMARGRTEFEGAPGARRPSRAAGMVMDITERKRADELAAVRLRLQEFAATHSLEDLLRATLDEAEVLSSSLVGFFHVVEAGERTLSLQAWSTRTVAAFCGAQGVGRRYSIEEAGVWVDCIRERRPVVHNDYASLPHKKGLPLLHAPVIRELVVPILRSNEVVAVLGVGNKATDYTQADVDAVAYLADVAWEIAQRKRAEKALGDSEEELEKIFNHSTNGIVFTEPASGKILKVNDTWVRESGVPRGEAIGKSAWALGLWASGQERDACMAALERQGRLREFEASMVFRGVQRPFALSAEFVELRGGRFVLWEFRDVTERNRMENELRESELRFRTLVGESPVAIAVIRGVVVLYANRMFQEVFALPSTESMIGQSFLACVAPQCRDEIVERSRRRAAGLPMVPEFETTALRLDGTQFPIHVTAAVVELPDGRATLFFVTDLSQRKRADEEIALLKRAIDVHVDAAFWMDTEGRITYANEAACKGLGFEPGELIGKPVVEVSPKLTAERLKDVWGALRREGFVKVESTHRRKDGSELPVEVLSSYVRFGGKEYACGFARDLTERKAAEQQRASLEAQLHHAQKMESIGRLAGGVAHDFNNMLSVILGNTELALGAVDPSDPLHADLVEIHRAAHRSADLTRQLLAFARKQTVVPKVLDLNVTLGGMLSMLRRLIGEDVELVWRPGGNLWPVKLDPSQIDQVLANLCVNARDAIAGVGRVTIETGNAVLDDAYCASRPGYMAGEYVRLAVSDDGCGMNEATLSQLFEPFFTTKTVGQGTGLGLATVYGIVRQNAGFIDVQSQPGMGTAFTIYLPRHLVESGHAGTPPAGELASLGHETILLVEDDPAVLRMSTRILTGQGYRVLGAGSPAEAVRIAEERAAQIHLLMTDVVMPEMNGRDLATKVLAKGPHIKCLFVSGYTADVIAHHGVLDEDVSFLHKPFSARALAVKVREVLGRG